MHRKSSKRFVGACNNSLNGYDSLHALIFCYVVRLRSKSLSRNSMARPRQGCERSIECFEPVCVCHPRVCITGTYARRAKAGTAVCFDRFLTRTGQELGRVALTVLANDFRSSASWTCVLLGIQLIFIVCSCKFGIITIHLLCHCLFLYISGHCTLIVCSALNCIQLNCAPQF
jgi:hypothetical protein